MCFRSGRSFPLSEPNEDAGGPLPPLGREGVKELKQLRLLKGHGGAEGRRIGIVGQPQKIIGGGVDRGHQAGKGFQGRL